MDKFDEFRYAIGRDGVDFEIRWAVASRDKRIFEAFADGRISIVAAYEEFMINNFGRKVNFMEWDADLDAFEEWLDLLGYERE